MPRKCKFQPHQEEEMARRYKVGVGLAKLAADFGASIPTIRKCVAKHAEIRPRGRPQKQTNNPVEAEAEKLAIGDHQLDTPVRPIADIQF